MSLPSGYKGPINPSPDDSESRIIIYGYLPSLALGVVGVVVFAIVFVGFAVASVVAVKDFRRRKRKADGRGEEGEKPEGEEKDEVVGSAMVRTPTLLWFFASAMEIVGYAARCYSHYRPFVVAGFVVNYVFIVVAPVFICACIYFTLFTLINRIPSGSDLLPFKPTIIIAFVVIDVVTTLLQIAGAALIGVASSAQVNGDHSSLTPEEANDILLSGLAAQCFGFLCFIVVLGITISRARRSHPTLASLFLTLFVGPCLLVFLRTVFRLAETAEGLFSYASTHEALFGSLEFAPVALASLWWLAAVFWWQGQITRRGSGRVT